MAKINVKAIYDTCRSLTSQINEQSKNNGEIDKGLLAGLENSFKQILDFERMFLVEAHNRFYGSILMQMDMDIDFSQRGAVDLKINSSEMRIGVNPIYCSKYSFPEFTFLIIQELHRMIDLHPTFYAELNSGKDPELHKKLEVASSVSTAATIERDVRLVEGPDYYKSSKMGCRMPQDVATSSILNEKLGIRTQKEQSLKYYFEVLKKFANESNMEEMTSAMSGGLETSSEGNSNSVATPNNSQGSQIHQWEGSDPEDVKDQVVSVVKNAYESLSERERGLLPSELVSAINALLAPPQIDWKQVLRSMVGSIPVPYRKSRARLNRRQPYRFDICGKLPKRTVNIVCCFDTSGSMSDEDLKYCVNEVFNIIKSYEGYKVTIIECDAEVQRVYQARNMNEIQTKMRGRGGTSFIPAINYINGEGEFSNKLKYPTAGNFRDALMVYFTDGYGDYEIPRPKTYRNLWVIMNGREHLSLKEPYGDVKSISTDKDFMRLKGR